MRFHFMKLPMPRYLFSLARPRLAVFALLLIPAVLCGADLRLAGMFGDHMVLQRDVPVPVWGWAAPGEKVNIEFAGQKKSAAAAASGKWMVKLDPMTASAESRPLTVTGNGSLTLSDVLVGDVWLCSGQSNMGIPMDVPGNEFLQQRIREADNPQLRFVQLAHQFPDQPAADTKGSWRIARPDTVRSWTAIGYLCGDKIQRELGVPVGIVGGAMGGTPIESWMSREVLLANHANEPYLEKHAAAVQQLPKTLPKFKKELAAFKERFPDTPSLVAENAARRQRGEPELREPRKPDGAADSARNPAACFNGKIAPFAPFAIKGVLWYQGEGNVNGFLQYPFQMADLMKLWRGLFGLPKLPFIMTELAPLGPVAAAPEDSARARFGEALAKTAKADGNAWVITIVDGGDPNNIHPAKKEIPGERFAAMALAKVYGRAGVAHGPVIKSWKTVDGGAEMKFDSAGGGLIAKAVNLGGHGVGDDFVHGIELVGKDKKFFPATARIAESDTVIAKCPQVPAPIAVRYAWAGFPLCNLYNREGFAAYPFRTDDWPFQQPAAPPSKESPAP